MKQFKWVSLFFLVLILYIPPALAANKVEVTYPPDTLYKSQSYTLVIKVEWPKSTGAYQFALPDLQTTNLKIERTGQAQEAFMSEDAEWTRKVFTFELIPENSGKAAVNKFSIQYINSEDQKNGAVEVEGKEFKVRTPIKEIISSPVSIIAISLTSITLVTVFVMLILKKRKRLKEQIPVELSLSDRSIEEIKNVRTSQLPLKDKLGKLSSELKSFLLKHYQISGISPQSSDAQILDTFKPMNLSVEELELMRKLFYKLQEIKYAAGASIQQYEYDNIEQEIIKIIAGKKINQNAVFS